MKNNIIIIDGIEIEINEEKNILKLAKENGIDIPALCFLEDCNNIGQCGVCVVEIEGQERLARACCIKAKAGMVVNTKSARVQEEVKSTVSVIIR